MMISSVLDPPMIQPEMAKHFFALAYMYICTGFMGVFVRHCEEKNWKEVYGAEYDRIWLSGMKILW
jgi:hypothetical protein